MRHSVSSLPREAIQRIGHVEWRKIVQDYREAKSKNEAKNFQPIKLANAVIYMAYVVNMSAIEIESEFGESVGWSYRMMKLQRLDENAQALLDVSLPAEQRLTCGDALTIVSSSPRGTHKERAQRLIRLKQPKGKRSYAPPPLHPDSS